MNEIQFIHPKNVECLLLYIAIFHCVLSFIIWCCLCFISMSVYLFYKSIQCFGYAVGAVRYNVLLLYKYCSLSICSDGDSEASVPGYMARPLIYFDSNAIIHPTNESWSEAMHWQHAIAPNRNVEDGLRNRTYLDTVILCMHLRRQVSGLFIWFISWINSLWPSDAIWSQRSGSTLAQVMACCLMAPSHYLNQCWLIIRKVQWHPSDSNLARNTPAINHWN